VEQAAIATLRDRLFTYLAEVERQNGLEIGTLPRRPPTRASTAASTSTASSRTSCRP
jgi:hypothetical protein